MDNFTFSSVGQTTTSSPIFKYVLGVAVIFIIAYGLYKYFKPRSKEVVRMGPYELKGAGAVPKKDSVVNVFEYSEVVSNLGNNFTFSFFLYMNDINIERIPIGSGGRGNEFRYRPLVTILGVNTIVIDPVHQKLRLQFNQYRGSPDTINLDVKDLMAARWNQITYTLEGRSVDIYLNGNLVKSALLENLPILYPVGVLLETSPDFSGQAGLFQAWPYRLTESAVQANYKRNVDTRGKPLIPDTDVVYRDVFKNIKDTFCELGFCGLKVKVGPMEYIDYDFA